MSSSHDSGADIARMRKRYRIIIAAVTFGAGVLILAVIVGALAALDHRVAESFFRTDPGPAQEHGNKTLSAVGIKPDGVTPAHSGSAGAAAVPSPERQNTTGEDQLDTTLDTQETIRKHIHHGRRRHRRRHAH